MNYYTLSSRLSNKAATGVPTRHGFNNMAMESFVLPAVGAMARPPVDLNQLSAGTESMSDEERIAVQKVVHFGQVLPIEDIEKVIDMVDSITRMPCGCRYINTGKTDKRYCFGLGIDKLGILGKYPDTSSSLEVLDKKEAKKLFRKYDEEGLMHSIWTGVTPYITGLCNCDHDCSAYKNAIEKRGAAGFFRAEYVCQVDALVVKNVCVNANLELNIIHLLYLKFTLILLDVTDVVCVGQLVRMMLLHYLLVERMK